MYKVLLFSLCYNIFIKEINLLIIMFRFNARPRAEGKKDNAPIVQEEPGVTEIESRRSFIKELAAAAAAGLAPKLASAQSVPTNRITEIDEHLIKQNRTILNEIVASKNALEGNRSVDNVSIFSNYTNATFLHFIHTQFERRLFEGQNGQEKIKMVFDSLCNMAGGKFYQIIDRQRYDVSQSHDIFGLFKDKDQLGVFLHGKKPDIDFIKDLFGFRKQLFMYYAPLNPYNSPHRLRKSKDENYTEVTIGGEKYFIKKDDTEQVSELQRDGVFMASVRGGIGYIVLQKGTRVITDKKSNKILSIASCNNPVFAGGLEACPTETVK